MGGHGGNKMDELQQYTGHLPRELDALRDSQDLMSFVNAQEQMLFLTA
jgi:hypothetical protein